MQTSSKMLTYRPTGVISKKRKHLNYKSKASLELYDVSCTQYRHATEMITVSCSRIHIFCVSLLSSLCVWYILCFLSLCSVILQGYLKFKVLAFKLWYTLHLASTYLCVKLLSGAQRCLYVYESISWDTLCFLQYHTYV